MITPAVRCHDLYAGEHWTGPRPCQASLLTPRLNFGPAPLDTGSSRRRPPYGHTQPRSRRATLTRFPGGTTGAAAWWDALAQLGRTRPRTATYLPRNSLSRIADATFLLVLSATYLQACRADIEAAAATIDQDRFMIVSAGTRAPTPLDQRLFPANARLQAHLGGTRQVLNVRIAETCLSGNLPVALPPPVISTDVGGPDPRSSGTTVKKFSVTPTRSEAGSGPA